MTQAHLPPGPRGRWLPTLKLIRNPRAAMEGWVRQFGDPFFLHALNGPVVVTGRADLIRTIHGQDPDIYEPFAAATIVPLMGSGSMLILQGEAHRRERRLMTPMFQGDRLRAYGGAMREVALRQLESRRLQSSVSTFELMTDISLEVIVRTIFGGHDAQLVAELMRVSRAVVASASPLLFFSRKTHFSCLGFTPWDRWQKAKTKLHRLLDEVIAGRQASGAKSDDILSLLCNAQYEDGQKISREHLYSELMTFLFAGHETTALTLTWAIYHIHKNPQVLMLLVQELDSPQDGDLAAIAAAPYLKATIQETLRINPIVTETLRKLKAPLQLGDFTIPTGMAVAPATVLAHYNAETYPQPDTFRPERFLDRSFSPFEFMPFGGGHRRCIGAAFASYEMAIVLGSLLRQYSFELIETREVVTKRRSVTMGLSSEVPVRVTKRE